MKFTKPSAKSDLEKIFLDQIETDTPEKIKNNVLLDFNNEKPFTFTLTKAQLDKYDPSGSGLGIDEWFINYEKEAKVSTAGIRGLQNPLYPWDTRYPLNLIGVMLATMGKILVAKDLGDKFEKIAACEVRYNSKMYVDLIARLQAGNGIKTYVTDNYMPIPIFLISFLIFMHDLYGGEYVTSSHAISRKIATKDLNKEGSQYIPDESMLFVGKVKEILDIIKEKGEYTFNFSGCSDPLLDTCFLPAINNGLDLYVEYLKNGIATDKNISYIKSSQKRIIVDCMGGSMEKTLTPIVERLKIADKYKLVHKEEDPFFHQIGKTIDKNGKFFDWSCDTTIMKADSVTKGINVPVVDTVDYATILKDEPIGTTVLMTDPDADRLVTAYIDGDDNIEMVKKMGLVYGRLDPGRILVIFTPNQSFLMTIDFQYKSLVQAGLWDKYNWFLMKTTASQRSWDEWGIAHHIPVINTPVGFKELADSMQWVEKKMKRGDKEIHLKDVREIDHNLGSNPRLLFAGEESGGEIFGPAELIKSKGGRTAISMREKSAGEAVIITSALSGYLEETGLTMPEYLRQIYDENGIKSRYEIRYDQKFYNESEPDIGVLLAAKDRGMEVKTKNNSFFLTIALGLRDGLINFRQAKEILSECFPDLKFDDLTEIKFVGDGTYYLFKDKCLEVRPSGTDAVNKGYCYGADQWECIKYASAFASYDGTRTKKHLELIPQTFYDNIENYAFELYTKYKQNQ